MNPLGRRRYSVDYCGRRFAYEGAKDSYHAGEQVVLFCPMVATDTDYSFTLDGERLPFDYQGDRGFRLEFTMPDHDVKLECFMKNSMVRENVSPIVPALNLIYSASVDRNLNVVLTEIGRTDD